MSKKFVIMGDSTCDVSEAFQKEYGIEMIPCHFTTPDGKEHLAECNWNIIARDDFYKDLRKHPDAYKTAPASVEEFRLAFLKHVEQDEAIVATCISSALSGTYSFMLSARNEILKEHPDAEIYILDSSRFGPAAGLMLVYVSNMRKEGKSAKEAFEWLEQNKNHFHQTGWMDDLSFIAKKGRLTHAKAFFGNLIGIKPIGEFDYNGLTTVIGKGKGEEKTLKILIEYMARVIIEPENQIIFIATSNRHKQAEIFRQMIIDRFHPKAVFVNDVYINCGINIGPGLMAAYYYGKPISQGLVEEMAIIKDIIEKQ